MLLRANTLLKKPEQDYHEDDLLVKRVIFQHDLLEQQIKNLEQQRSQLDAQMMSYTQLVQLARSELTGKGIQDSIVQQLQ